MPRTARSIDVLVTAGFVAAICSVPLIQIGSEFLRGESPRFLEIFSSAPTAANLRAYKEDLEEAGVVAGQLRPWMQYAQFVLLESAGEKAFVGLDGWLFYRPGIEYMTERMPVDAASASRGDPLRAILSFRDALAARGIRLLVVPAPNKESIYPDKLTSRADPMQTIVCRHTRDLMDKLETSGVEVVDLFEIYGRAKRQTGASKGAPLYLAQDSHWSPAGLALAAKAVAERVLAEGWVSPGAIEHDEKPAPIRRIGDVARMLRSPPIEGRLGPEDVPCAQVLRRDTGTLYKDSPDSEVLVLGDSFLRIYEQDEPGSAGFIAHLARELKRPLTSIVNDGGASTMVRQELHRRAALLAGKKVVIWEFVERDIRFGAEGWQDVPLPDR